MSNLRLISGGQDKTSGGRGSSSAAQLSNVKGMGMADFVWPHHGLPQSRKRPVVLMKGGTIRDADNLVPLIDVWHFTALVDGEPVQFALNPCYYLPDPTRPLSYLVCCEVKTLEGEPAETNHRATLRATHEKLGGAQDSLDTLGSTWGFRQGYQVLDDEGDVVGAAAASQVFEYHLGACLDAGIMLSGADPISQRFGQWSFEISDRNFPEILDPDPANPLIMADMFMLARHLLVKTALDKGFRIAFSGTTVLYSNRDLVKGNAQELADRFIRELEPVFLDIPPVPPKAAVESWDRPVFIPVPKKAPKAVVEHSWDRTDREFGVSRIAIPVSPAADPYLSAAKVLAVVSKDIHEAEAE